MRFWRRKARDRELERELRTHLDLEAEEQQEAGLSPEEAHYSAKRAFGNPSLIKEDLREVWGRTFFEALGQGPTLCVPQPARKSGFRADSNFVPQPWDRREHGDLLLREYSLVETSARA
jgi:hypothetical protein